MRHFAALLLVCLCSGCAIPHYRSLAEQPGFSQFRHAVLTTTKVTHLSKNGLEAQPDHERWYLLTPPLGQPWDHAMAQEPRFTLPAHTRLQIQLLNHVYYPPYLLAYAPVQAHNEYGATIVSGPYTGVKVWGIWEDHPGRLPDYLARNL